MEVFSSFFSSAANTAELNSTARTIDNFIMTSDTGESVCHAGFAEHRHLACGAVGRLAWWHKIRQARRPPSPQPKTAVFLTELARMVLLQTAHAHFAFLQRANTVRAGQGSAHRGHDRNALRERGIANAHFVLARNLSARCVDDEIDIAVLDPVENVRTTFSHFKHF